MHEDPAVHSVRDGGPGFGEQVIDGAQHQLRSGTVRQGSESGADILSAGVRARFGGHALSMAKKATRRNRCAYRLSE
ncbi:hypothetical protein GCM10027598_06060 [Amycolatopsis oliviviridis]|uniref:Uncharacterized protein n=1 Tax=Amycolatopsis oliviviridis TaxID=1471590 RepID=A0ABQ3LLL4_9PSEU|nr:hypothetical protein GCM10017790_39460 [Amycolatopsis oliviviridis]